MLHTIARRGSARAVFSVAVLAISFASCAEFEGRLSNHGVSSVQFSDIPVPQGMQLRTRAFESHSYETGRFRFGHFEYYGDIGAEDAVVYMRDRMDQHGWHLTEESDLPLAEAGYQTGGLAKEMRFRRQPYETTCTVWEDEGVTRMSVAVQTRVDVLGG